VSCKAAIRVRPKASLRALGHARLMIQSRGAATETPKRRNRRNPRILPPLRGSESILHPFPKARRLALGFNSERCSAARLVITPTRIFPLFS
jgi:hypothetical protein